MNGKHPYPPEEAIRGRDVNAAVGPRLDHLRMPAPGERLSAFEAIPQVIMGVHASRACQVFDRSIVDGGGPLGAIRDNSDYSHP